jgi:rod shape determining protein RodA
VIFAITGFVVMVICFVVDYRHLETWGYPLYAVAILALLAVRAVGHASGYGDAAGSAGAVREIKLGPFAIQPSEFVVLAMMFAVGVYAHRHEGRLSSLDVVKLLLLGGLPMVLVLAQPDLGTTIILAVVLFTMLVVAGVPLRYLAVISVAAVLAFFGALHLHLLQGYQLQRITGFLNQNCNLAQNYNLCLSKTAIGAGGFRGVGLFHGVFTNNQYVPVQYADFIFSAIGEQFGFVGSALVLGLYALLALRTFRAIHLARDPLGRLICGGSLAFLVFSVFQNVGMTMGLVPITGIPLPFISYGGSALFAFFAAVGLVANVEYRRLAGR